MKSGEPKTIGNGAWARHGGASDAPEDAPPNASSWRNWAVAAGTSAASAGLIVAGSVVSGASDGFGRPQCRVS